MNCSSKIAGQPSCSSNLGLPHCSTHTEDAPPWHPYTGEPRLVILLKLKCSLIQAVQVSSRCTQWLHQPRQSCNDKAFPIAQGFLSVLKGITYCTATRAMVFRSRAPLRLFLHLCFMVDSRWLHIVHQGHIVLAPCSGKGRLPPRAPAGAAATPASDPVLAGQVPGGCCCEAGSESLLLLCDQLKCQVRGRCCYLILMFGLCRCSC